MKKNAKGTIGYLNTQKKRELAKTLIMLMLVLAVFFTGLITTGTRKNWFTLAAVLGCLPMAQCAVHYIVRIPYRSADRESTSEIRKAAGNMPVLFDFVFTTKSDNYAVESLAISHHTICGMVSHKKTDLRAAEKYLQDHLKNNSHPNVSLKLFDNREAYLRRLSQMQCVYKIEAADLVMLAETGISMTAAEARIMRTLMSISL